MLTQDELIREAKRRAMPVSKIRGIVREYIQIIILKAISESKINRNISFIGGTCLRLVYSMGRFSEDLDFNGRGVTEECLENALSAAVSAVRLIGFKAAYSFRLTGQKVWQGDIKILGILQHYKCSTFNGRPIPQDEALHIKLDINQPGYEFSFVPAQVGGYGYNYPALHMPPEEMLSEKTDALLHRPQRMGRDFYDILFLLNMGITPSLKILKAAGIKVKNLAEWFNLLEQQRKNITDSELDFLAEKLRPFLFDEAGAELVKNFFTILGQHRKKQSQA